MYTCLSDAHWLEACCIQLFIYLFLLTYSLRHFFSNCFIQIRVLEDPEPILRKLVMRLEYILDGMPVNCTVPCTHTFAHSFTIRCNLFMISWPTWEKTGEPEGNAHEHMDSMWKPTLTIIRVLWTLELWSSNIPDISLFLKGVHFRGKNIHVLCLSSTVV